MYSKIRIAMERNSVILGQSTPKMRTQLKEDEVMKGFGLINLHAFDYEQLLHSQIPEEIILAILSKYNAEEVEQIIDAIISRLKEVSGNEIALQKYARQLAILSRLRNFEEVVTKKTKEMPITYDIKKDYLYREGKKEGIEKEKQKMIKEKQKMIREMLWITDLSTEQIAKIASVSVSYVEDIKAKLKRK